MDSPTLLNVAMYRVVRHWLSLALEEKSAVRDGIGMEVGSSQGVFYADDSLIELRARTGFKGQYMSSSASSIESDWWPTSKSPRGAIFTGMSQEDFVWKNTGDGATYWERLR